MLKLKKQKKTKKTVKHYFLLKHRWF